MAASSYTCSVVQGFNFQKDRQDRVGHITKIKIAGEAQKSDLNVTDPEDVTKVVKVFGIISQIHWDGGYADGVNLACQVSTDNRNTLTALTHTKLSNTEVELEFVVYDYDPLQKKFFKAFHTDTTALLCLIEKSGDDLNMAISSDQGYEVQSPKNFAFMLGVVPQDKDQKIHLAVSVSAKIVKKWGVAVAS